MLIESCRLLDRVVLILTSLGLAADRVEHLQRRPIFCLSSCLLVFNGQPAIDQQLLLSSSLAACLGTPASSLYISLSLAPRSIHSLLLCCCPVRRVTVLEFGAPTCLVVDDTGTLLDT